MARFQDGVVQGLVREEEPHAIEKLAPCCTNAGGILPLSDFGTVDFGDDYTGVGSTNDAIDSSTSEPIGAFGSNIQEAIMVNGTTGANEAVPSGLSSDGTSFAVNWDSE
jgi:hypothetical protein